MQVVDAEEHAPGRAGREVVVAVAIRLVLQSVAVGNPAEGGILQFLEKRSRDAVAQDDIAVLVEMGDLFGGQVVVAGACHGGPFLYPVTKVVTNFPSWFRRCIALFQKVTMSLMTEPQQQGNTFGFVAWHGASTVMSAPHAHNDIEVNYSTSELVYSSAGKTTTLPAGTPCAFWGAKPHQLIQIDEGHLMAFVTIPLARFMSWGVPENVKDRLLRGTVLIGSAESVPGELGPGFDRWMRELAQTQRGERRAAELEVEALLWRMADGQLGGDDARTRSVVDRPRTRIPDGDLHLRAFE